MLVNIDEIGNTYRAAVLVAFKVAFEVTPCGDGFNLQTIIQFPVQCRRRTPDIQLLKTRVRSKILFLAAVINIKLVYTKGIALLSCCETFQELKGKSCWVGDIKKVAPDK